MYLHIYIYRERERERCISYLSIASLSLSVHIYIYIYMNTHTSYIMCYFIISYQVLGLARDKGLWVEDEKGGCRGPLSL